LTSPSGLSGYHCVPATLLLCLQITECASLRPLFWKGWPETLLRLPHFVGARRFPGGASVFTTILSVAYLALLSTTDRQGGDPSWGRFLLSPLACGGCRFQFGLLLCFLEIFPIMLAPDICLPCTLQWCAASPGETPVRLLSTGHNHECWVGMDANLCTKHPRSSRRGNTSSVTTSACSLWFIEPYSSSVGWWLRGWVWWSLKQRGDVGASCCCQTGCREDLLEQYYPTIFGESSSRRSDHSWRIALLAFWLPVHYHDIILLISASLLPFVSVLFSLKQHYIDRRSPPPTPTRAHECSSCWAPYECQL